VPIDSLLENKAQGPIASVGDDDGESLLVSSPSPVVATFFLGLVSFLAPADFRKGEEDP
jgi:hypothetical protein